MNILTNGNSFSRGPGAWPNHVAQWYGADLVNLAQAGAGNTYIRHTTMAELQIRNYDLVLIMWSGLKWLDIQVSDIDSFDRSIYTSKHQSQQNDWPEKIVEPVNDQDYVQKNWVFGSGYLNQEKEILNLGLFEKLYLHQDRPQHLERSFHDMLCLESYLKSRNIPYAFAFYQNYVDSMGSLVNGLDWNHIYNKTNIMDVTRQLNDYDTDGLHPGLKAQQSWALDFYQFLKSLK